MVSPDRGWKAVKTFGEMIKIEHSIFALPFALLGAMWGAMSLGNGPVPSAEKIIWILIAMVSCRSAAMAFNRIVDRDVDAKNPRTAIRALVTGQLRLKDARVFTALSIVIFLVAAWQLGPLPLMLSPIALLFTLGYSYMKRVSWLCHFVLGMSLGIAPSAAYIGVTGTLSWAPVLLFLAVTFWTAGFDLIYALQDDAFDKGEGLHSFPARFGRNIALKTSRICHLLAIGCLAYAGILQAVGPIYYVGVGVAAMLLAYEQSLVKVDDLSKVNLAFFTLNGYVSVGVFFFAMGDVIF
jgi:4-hydroxybenzoate polyprenyltransferase